MAVQTHTTTLGDRTLTFEYGRFAEQADAAITLTCGETIILATTVTSKSTMSGK